MRFLIAHYIRPFVGIVKPFCTAGLLAIAMIPAQALPSSGAAFVISHPISTDRNMDRPDFRLDRKSRMGAEAAPGNFMQRAGDQAAGGKSPFVTFRGGLTIAPSLGFAGGIDFTIPSLSLSSHLITRLDGDVLATFKAQSFGGYPGTTFGFTADQIYSPLWGGRYSPYIGFGLGPYWQETVFFGGKAFVGVQFGPAVSAEMTVHFPGQGAAIIALQVRVSAL